MKNIVIATAAVNSALTIPLGSAIVPDAFDSIGGWLAIGCIYFAGLACNIVTAWCMVRSTRRRVPDAAEMGRLWAAVKRCKDEQDRDCRDRDASLRDIYDKITPLTSTAASQAATLAALSERLSELTRRLS
jgi:hypothetical protein